MLPLELTRPELERFDEEYRAAYAEGMRRKLGLREEQPSDTALVQGLLDTMQVALWLELKKPAPGCPAFRLAPLLPDP